MKLRAILLIVSLYIIYGYVEACQGFRSMDQMPMTKSKIHKKRRTFGMNPSIRDGVHRSGMPLYLHLKRI